MTTFGEGGGALLWIILSDCVPYSRSFEFIVARCVVVPGFFWGEFLDVFRSFLSRLCCVLCVLRSARKCSGGFAEFGVSFDPSCTDSASFTCAFLSFDCGFCLLLCCSVIDISILERIDVISFGFSFFF